MPLFKGLHLAFSIVDDDIFASRVLEKLVLHAEDFVGVSSHAVVLVALIVPIVAEGGGVGRWRCYGPAVVDGPSQLVLGGCLPEGEAGGARD